MSNPFPMLPGESENEFFGRWVKANQHRLRKSSNPEKFITLSRVKEMFKAMTGHDLTTPDRTLYRWLGKLGEDDENTPVNIQVLNVNYGTQVSQIGISNAVGQALNSYQETDKKVETREIPSHESQEQSGQEHNNTTQEREEEELIAHLDAALTAHADSEQRREQTEAKILELEQQLTKELETAQQARDESEKHREEAEAKILELEHAVNEHARNKESLDQQLAKLESTLDNTTQEREELDQQNSNLNRRIQSLETQLIDAQERLQEETRQKLSAQAQARNFQRDLVNAEDQRKELEQQLKNALVALRTQFANALQEMIDSLENTSSSV